VPPGSDQFLTAIISHKATHTSSDNFDCFNLLIKVFNPGILTWLISGWQQGRTELSKVKPDYHWPAFLLTVGNKSWTGDLLVPAESILPLGKGISSSKTGATCFSAQFHGSKYLTFLLHSLKCVITENIFQLSFSLQYLESWSSFTVLSLTVQF
jgi:hypothetical protein